MATQRREVWQSLETAHSGLAIAESLIAEKLHPDDRKQIDALIEKVRTAIDRAQTHLTDALRDVQNAINRI